ncbi:hypothetical protein MNV49_001813 [Pseudohyphozyma bogoriensis]|nr:hypothetical protein MNV49_001813 [Pseudohyphozyma bogoriensis]
MSSIPSDIDKTEYGKPGKEVRLEHAENPLAHLSHDTIKQLASAFAKEYGLEEYEQAIVGGALVAADPAEYSSQPKSLWWLVIMCSVAAAVNGMDATVINGANLFWPTQFGIADSSILQGLVNSAPFFMGVGIGPKSAIVPVYSAECCPPLIRGSLVMAWQIFTAFGIMMGFVMSLAFRGVKDTPHITGLNWRLMLGSAGIPALVVMLQVYACPESPRWLMGRGRYQDAMKSLRRIRAAPIQAGRDIFYIHTLLEQEKALTGQATGSGRAEFFKRATELFTIPRVRRATLASAVVMMSQQLCGVNVMSFYSSTIFADAGFSEQSALLASFGFGLLNFVFAFPGVYTIDHWGRRKILLSTFPFLSLLLMVVAVAFYIPSDSKAHIAVIALGIYIYTIFYSVGEGPVPFTYSAEIFPLRQRQLGMAWATSALWFGSTVLSLTFPYLMDRFTPTGAFFYYATWCAIFFFLILLFLPESAKLSLEELDVVFSVSTRTHAAYQWREFIRFFKVNVFRQSVPPQEPLYDFSHLSSAQDRVRKNESA